MTLARFVERERGPENGKRHFSCGYGWSGVLSCVASDAAGGRGERMTERKMKDGFWMLLCAACLLLSARSVQARELTALDIFAQLPITLFENTPEGLSEDEKLRLDRAGGKRILGGGAVRRRSPRTGIAAFWRDAGGARVFRGGDRLLAALGTDGGAMCALSSGRKTPPVDSCPGQSAG